MISYLSCVFQSSVFPSQDSLGSPVPHASFSLLSHTLIIPQPSFYGKQPGFLHELPRIRRFVAALNLSTVLNTFTIWMEKEERIVYNKSSGSVLCRKSAPSMQRYTCHESKGVASLLHNSRAAAFIKNFHEMALTTTYDIALRIAPLLRSSRNPTKTRNSPHSRCSCGFIARFC